MLYRVAWTIPHWGSGHTDWFDNHDFAEHMVRRKNAAHGEGTHWVETLEKLEDEQLPGAIKELKPN